MRARPSSGNGQNAHVLKDRGSILPVKVTRRITPGVVSIEEVHAGRGWNRYQGIRQCAGRESIGAKPAYRHSSAIVIVLLGILQSERPGDLIGSAPYA